MKKQSFVRISSLLWADILVAYALFVMQNYLTDVWKLSLTHAAGVLNFWNGIYRILPVFFLYLVDSFLGNFRLLVFTSISYSAGIVLVFLSAPPILAKSTHTCKDYEPQCIGHTQESLLYAGLVLIAVGVAGNIVSVKPFLEEQKDPNAGSTPRGDVSQVFGLFGVVVVGIAGAVALPYIKPWTLRFGIPAICTVLGTLWFFSGSCNYKDEGPKEDGSPLGNVGRVFIAASLKMFRSYPDNNQGYYGMTDSTRFTSTSCLRALHKAAIILPGEEDGSINRWRLCTVAEVEDAKIAVRMVPMWMTFVVCGIVSSAGDTYFVEQAGKLNRSIGKLKLPIQVLLLAKRWTEGAVGGWAFSWLNQDGRRNSAPSFGIAFGMICSVLCCIAAAGTEQIRLKAVRRHGLLDKADEDVPMSIYWLVFQFLLLGGLDSLLEKSVNAYYRDQSPKSMQGYLENFTRGVSGLGFMCSSLSVYIVGRISERGGRRNWFQETLNQSRLDRYYWFLAVLTSVNLIVFVAVASRYRYKIPERGQEEVEAGGAFTDGYEEKDDGNSCFGCL